MLRHGHQSERNPLMVPEHGFGHRARALAPEVVLGHRGTGTNLNRFSSEPDVFIFSHAVEALTPDLSPISRLFLPFPSCL